MSAARDVSEFDDLEDLDTLIEKIEDTTWYHVSHNGELVMGANRKTDVPLYKAVDVKLAIYSVPVVENIAPRSFVDKARRDGYERGIRDAARKICNALCREIAEARNSNFEAIKERETKHGVNRYEDGFCRYCDGEIHALDGISYFTQELAKEFLWEVTSGA